MSETLPQRADSPSRYNDGMDPWAFIGWVIVGVLLLLGVAFLVLLVLHLRDRLAVRRLHVATRDVVPAVGQIWINPPARIEMITDIYRNSATGEISCIVLESKLPHGKVTLTIPLAAWRSQIYGLGMYLSNGAA